jgi:hypothetical protein
MRERPIPIPYEAGVHEADLRRGAVDTIVAILLRPVTQARDRIRLSVLFEEAIFSLKSVRELYADPARMHAFFADEEGNSDRVLHNKLLKDSFVNYGEVVRKERLSSLEESPWHEPHMAGYDEGICWEQKAGTEGGVLDDYLLWSFFSPKVLLRIFLTYPEICEREDVLAILFPEDGSREPLDAIVEQFLFILDIAYPEAGGGEPVPYYEQAREPNVPDARICLDWGAVRCATYVLEYAQLPGHGRYGPRVAAMLTRKYGQCRRSLLNFAMEGAGRVGELRMHFSEALIRFATAGSVAQNPAFSEALAAVSGHAVNFSFGEEQRGVFSRVTVPLTPLRLVDDLHSDFPLQRPQRADLAQKIDRLSDENPIRKEFSGWYPGRLRALWHRLGGAALPFGEPASGFGSS